MKSFTNPDIIEIHSQTDKLYFTLSRDNSQIPQHLYIPRDGGTCSFGICSAYSHLTILKFTQLSSKTQLAAYHSTINTHK